MRRVRAAASGDTQANRRVAAAERLLFPEDLHPMHQAIGG